MDYKELIKVALDYRNRAYSPYSDFKVGAAVLFENGKGCSLECSVPSNRWSPNRGREFETSTWISGRVDGAL